MRPGIAVLSQPRAFALTALLLASGLAQGQSWLETQIEVERLSRIGNFPAASELGDTLIDELTDALGPTSEQLANAHLLLANVEAANAAHLAAESHLLDAIDILEALDGTQATSLIAPFVMLGTAYRGAGEYELALGAYQEARDIGRRRYGLLNEDQIEILDQMSLTQLYMGDLDAAKEHQLDAVIVMQRRYGDDSIEYLDANYRYADWLRDLGLFAEAEKHYFAMHRLINRNYDGDPVQEVRLLRVQAMNQREATANPRAMGGFGPSVVGLSGILPQDLERALKIVQKQDDPDPVLLATVLRDIGDWNIAYGRIDEIAAPYLEAWNLLEDVEGGDELQRQWFEEQTFIYAPPLRSRLVVDHPAAPRGRVDVVFTIDRWGGTRDVEVIGAVPAGLVDNAAVEFIRDARLRPRIVGGELVESSGAYSLEFRYDPQRAMRYSGAVPIPR